MSKITLFWFRRDLRLDDNAGLYHALKDSGSVQPVFIFDPAILDSLEKDDSRVTFIYRALENLQGELRSMGSDLWVFYGRPLEVFKKIQQKHALAGIYCNHDYEPSARRRDSEIQEFLNSQGLLFKTFKDQTLFEKDEIMTGQGRPYTVYTPYKNKVLSTLNDFYLKSYPTHLYFKNFRAKNGDSHWCDLPSMGFVASSLEFPDLEVSSETLRLYAKQRDFPFIDKGTSRLGVHLRFGTVSVRELAREAKKLSDVWLSELIWRDFFMQILWHYPHVERESFRREYDKIAWRSSTQDFSRWSEGMTGYPLVDAGMRELNATGHMHNRVRMVVASFLTKHLLIHWHQGERYFASKLLDYDLSANNGNWQWAAGSGCDAAPYFRVFNPQTQFEKFDPEGLYVQRWVPEYGSSRYVKPMIDHAEARGRCLFEYTKVLKGAGK